MSTVSSNPIQDVDRMHADVSASFAAALAEIDGLDIDQQEGKADIGDILARLDALQAQFDGELGKLQEQTEWDQCAVAFFGENEDGKRTVTHSLRVLLDEDSRRQLVEQNERDLARFETALDAHIATLRQGLLDAQSACQKAIADVRRDLDARSAALLADTAASSERCRHEIATIGQALDDRNAANRQLGSDLAAARQDMIVASERFDATLAAARRRALVFALAGCAAGAAAVLALRAVLG